MNSHWVPGSEAQAGQSGRTAIVLITDKNYIVPTFSSALSADAHTTNDKVDINLFVVNADEAWVRQFEKAVIGTKIRVLPAVLQHFPELSQFHNDRFLPPITLARFWISSLLEPDIERFLYIDGDTMVDGELDSLLAVEPPSEGLMAAVDFVKIYIDEVGLGKWKDVRYLREIECDPDFYFNAGVIYASRRAWDDLVGVAKNFMREHTDLCIASDQTALNYAARDKITLLPLRYNYQTDHMMIVDPREIGKRATIWHFTGAPKPWIAPEWPWDDQFNRFYRLAEQRLQDCGVPSPVPPEKHAEALMAHRERTRTRLKWLYPWRKSNRRRTILPMLLH